MTSATTSDGRLEPIAAPHARTGGLGTVLAFAALSLGLAAAATLGGVPPALVPFVMAIGPMFLALGLAWREGGGAVRRLLASAVRTPNRRAWYALVALPIAWALTVVAVALVLGDPAVGAFDKVFPAILIIPLIVLIPAFAEEIAWRGYAVERLAPIATPLGAALILGVPWAAMHLFLELPGQMNAGLDWWPTMLSLLGYSVILTWAYLGSGGSVLLVGLIHAGLNGVAPLMGGLIVDRTWIIRALLAATIAVAIILRGGLGLRVGRIRSGQAAG